MDVVLDLTQPPQVAAPGLDVAQRSVVAHRRGPLLVLAGPGTGKTTTLVEAIVARLRDEHAPLAADEILGLTFGRRAAGELRDRVLARVGGGLVPTISTFHAFAYAALRTMSSEEDFQSPPRLLSGAEQEARIRDVLRGAVDEKSIDWPDDLTDGIATMGMAAEVRAVLARATELGITGEQLASIGSQADRPAWAAIGALAEQLDGTDVLENVLDYSQLLVQVAGEFEIRASRGDYFGGYKAIFVDEYQDTDPVQVRLLQALCGPETALVVVGDPDQSIYAFRGADRSGIMGFPDRFLTDEGTPAPVVVLDRTRRFGPRLRTAVTELMAADPLVFPDARGRNLAAAHRTPATDPRPEAADLVEVISYDSESALAGHVADELMRVHLHDGLAWDDMAIIVRAAHQIEPLVRAMSATGVPVGVAPDEVPLHTEPAVAALVLALKVASDTAQFTPWAARELLLGPIGNVDPADLRPVARALRARFRDEHLDTPAPSSDELIRDCLRQPAILDSLAESSGSARGIAGVRALGELLAKAQAQVVAQASPAEVLWTLWAGSTWPQRLRTRALAGSVSAGHDIDCVMALFDTAERSASRSARLGLSVFWHNLEAQQIPAEQITERGAPADCVKVLSAHRAKGLEWDFVVVVGAQEGHWPDLRPRGTVLQADRLTVDGLGPAPHMGQLLDEERRLFYVACTRARTRLLVAVVETPDHGSSDASAPPSRFVADLGLAGVRRESVPGRRTRRRTLAGLVASLRSALQDPAASPQLKAAAARRLAQLASASGADGRALVSGAHPDSWWGVLPRSEGAEPVRPEGAPVALSASALESIALCPLRWYLDREAGVEVRKSSAMAFGSIVHTIAERVATGEVPADLDVMCNLLDAVWKEVAFDSAWQERAEYQSAREALSRFLVYHTAADRELLATEAEFAVTLDFSQSDDDSQRMRAHVRGFLDRIERDDDGSIVPIDFKTARNPEGRKTVDDHLQLQLYQYVIEQGAFPDFGCQPGGGALVQLRASDSAGDGPLVQTQRPLPPDQGVRRSVEVQLVSAIDAIRDERFDATKGKACEWCAYRKVCPVQSEQVIP